MKQQLRILSKKELKPILKYVKERWGVVFEPDFGFLFNPKKNRLYAVTKDINKVDVDKLNVTAVGMYFGEWKNAELRLSIEGSQIIGPKATKNVVELSKSELNEWLKGTDLDKKVRQEGFVIIKHDKDFVGSGKVKEGKILNFVPKARRLLVQV